MKAARASHQADLSGMNLTFDGSPVAKKTKIGSGKVIGDSSTSNSQCQLHMIRPKWNVALEDYVAMGSFANELAENSPRIEIDGKKINL